MISYPYHITENSELKALRTHTAFQIPSLHCSQARLNVRLSTGDSDPNKISISGFGIPWKTKSWMPGKYYIHTVAPALDTPTPVTSHCCYPIPSVPCELPFVLVFACAAKTVQTLCRDPSQPHPRDHPLDTPRHHQLVHQLAHLLITMEGTVARLCLLPCCWQYATSSF